MEQLRHRLKHQRRNWLVLGILLALLCLGPRGAARAQSGGFSARYDVVPCSTLALQTPASLMQSLNLQCGWLTVPAVHADPSGPTIQLAVVIIKSASASPSPDPLVMLQGGPGGSTIDTYTQLIPLDARLRSLDRDIVLFDQRGTEYSKPSLFCQAYYDESIRQLNEDLTHAEADRRAQVALQTCHDQWVKNGVNLSAFDTLENAADVESLRQALGYQKINLYGVSYGTEVVLQYSRSYPQGLRSAIIDSVLPPQINFIQDAPSTSQRALEAVFTACASQPECNTAYPNLKQVFYQQVDRLNKAKAHIEVTDPKSGQVYPALLDGSGLINSILQMLYLTDMVPLTPRVIYQVKNNDYRFLENIIALTTFDKSLNMGMYFSVVCSEDTQIDAQKLNLAGMPSQLADYETEMVQQVAQTCSFWKVDPIADTAHQPVASNVPTLVLAGAFDPATPPAYAQQAAQTLAKSYFVLFPIGGHGQLTSGECQDAVFLQFLDTPTQKPVTTCVEQQKMSFSVPGSLVRLPVLINLLNLQGAVGAQLAVYALALLILLSALVIYPGVWLVRRLRGPSRPPIELAGQVAAVPATTVAPGARPFFYRIAPWMAAVAGIALLAVMVVIYVVGFQLALKNDSRVLLGLPGDTRPAFLLPLLAALMAVLMLAGAVAAWARRAGSAGGRIYLTLISLAALVCVVIAGIWGILFGFFNG
ncbi:MAG TPA: alpha/beta fold hydrolase [Anaerolineaceae bacterium]